MPNRFSMEKELVELFMELEQMLYRAVRASLVIGHLYYDNIRIFSIVFYW